MSLVSTACRAAAIVAILGILAPAARAADGRTDKEKAAIAVLRGASPEADKALACKQLAIHGSADAVPDLAKLLGDARLASWARIALEAIPGDEAGAALRASAAGLSGDLLVGAINSLGVRRDAAALEVLSQRLRGDDAAAAEAAAVALGRLGTQAAASALEAALPRASGALESAVAEGLVLAAESALAAGKSAEAVRIYDLVRASGAPPQRLLEATRGAILARGDDGAGLLIEQLDSPEQKTFRLGLTVAREVKAGKCDAALVAQVAKLPAPRAALLLRALGDRRTPEATAALVAAAAKGARETRLAALEALGGAGDASAIAVLLAGAEDADAELARAATASLSALSGAEVDAEIKKRLPQAKGKILPMLLELVGQRRIDAIPPALAAVDSQDAATRAAALAALGNIVDVERLPVLVKAVTAPRDAADAANARKALLTAAIRMPDREACAGAIAGPLAAAPADARDVLLEALGQVGGTKALAAVAGAAKTGDDRQKDAATRLLGEWMTADAAPVLLDLSKTLGEDKYRGRAIRGYIRIARQFKLEQAQRASMAREAWAAAKTDAERKLVLEVARRYPDTAMLELAAKAGAQAGVKPEARIAAAAILQRLPEASADAYRLAEGLGLKKVKLEIVKATYGAGERQKDVTDVVRKNAGSLPLLFIPGDNFNKVFGGDPAPGDKKLLTIRYTIDGKPGEARIEENGTIELPLP
ncbi:MAG: hypothetical protein ACKO3G_09590 [Planctomycetaceae bacterium]